jgi:DNA-binding NtrC family response regulator
VPVLIVESQPELGALWKRHLERGGAKIILTCGQDEAVAVLRTTDVRVILLDLVLAQGSALAVADFASYRRPEAKVIFVTSTGVFSDGSIFQVVPNAWALLPTATPPEDLAAMVDHYGRAA